MTTEDYWSFGLLGLSILALLGGVIGAYAIARSPNTVVRKAFPISALVILAMYAGFIYEARLHVKG